MMRYLSTFFSNTLVTDSLFPTHFQYSPVGLISDAKSFLECITFTVHPVANSLHVKLL